MTTTDHRATAGPSDRAAALEQAHAGAADRFVLESFVTQDGENTDPVTGVVPAITIWGVFDVTQRDDGRRGMVWLPRSENIEHYGFQADPDHDAAQVLLEQVRAAFVTEVMVVWDLNHAGVPIVPDHQVIRLDTPHDNSDATRRLCQLVAQYDRAKVEADDAALLLKEITDGIKAEVRTLHPRQGDFTIVSGTLLAHPLTLQRVVSRRFDTAGAKAVLTGEQYDALCKETESWVLKAKKG